MNPVARLGWLLGALTVSVPSRADVSAVRASLSWDAEPGCSAAPELKRAVDARLGRATFSDVDPEVSVRGVVRRNPSGGWRVEIHLADAAGTTLGRRLMESPARDCRALDESVALVVALMVDIPRSELVQRRAEPPPEPPPPRRLTLPVPAPAPTMTPASPWSFNARVEALLALGFLPGVVPALSAGLVIDPGRVLALDVELAYFFGRRAEEGSAGADFDAYTLGLYACPVRLDVASGLLLGCVGQRAGGVRVGGFGFDDNRDATTFIFDVGARVRLGLPLWGSLRFEAALGAEFPLTRSEFFATEASGVRSEIFRQSPVIGTAQAGLGLSFR